MANHASLLLSRIINENDVAALDRHHVTKRHFTSKTDKDVYDFIKDYAHTNRGKAPSYAAVLQAFPKFTYIPDAEDSFEYLTKKLFNEAAFDELADFINGEVSKEELRKNPDATLEKMFENHANDMPTLINTLTEKLTDIRLRTEIRDTVGVDVKKDIGGFLEEYRKRKNGESIKTWASRYSCVDKYESGNLYVVFGKSGRGKSVTTLADALYAAQQGANVLMWSLEMGSFETLVRIYSILSADAGEQSVNIAGINMDAGFSTGDLRSGTLSDAFEAQFEDFLKNLNSNLKGNIIVRATDDDDFVNRDLHALEADILHTEADFVVIDAFYHLDYSENTSRTAGGDAAETSKRLRRMLGRMKVVGVAITQSDEVAEDVDDDGKRELSLPKRSEVKKTKALLEDASILIGIDTSYMEGRGIVGIQKGRNGGEGTMTEIVYVPGCGICREIAVGEVSVQDFEF